MTDAIQIGLALGLPLLGAVGIGLARRNPNLRETVTLATAFALALAVWSLVPAVQAGLRPELVIAELLPGVQLAFRVEPLGMLFAGLASLLWIFNSIYSIGYMRGNHEAHQTRFYACFAIALSATMGIAFAGNLLTLFLCYEALTLSTYLLVAHKGDPNAVKAARVYLGILLCTSIGFFLPALIWTWQLTGTLDFVPGGLYGEDIPSLTLGLLFVLFVFGTGKAALMPVHRWLPAAMVAPTPVSALLHAVAVVKSGVFVIIKLVVYVFGADNLPAIGTELVIYVAAFTTIAASIVALQQTNLKRLLAYSTVGQLAFIVLAVCALAPLAAPGAALHLVSHAFGKITLFFAAGAIYTASKKTELSQLAGIGYRMPLTMAAFSIGALSMIGMPPTAGFVSKWYVLSGALQADNLVVPVTIMASGLLNAAYFLPILYSAWIRRPDEQDQHGEAPWPILIAITATALMTLAFFVYNRPAHGLEVQLFGS